MNEKQHGYLRLAEESIFAAKALSENRVYPGFIVSRAYYAMFYCASALLEGIGLRYSTHGSVIGAFGREFVKTGKLPQSLHIHLREAFDGRLIGDYEPESNVGINDATETIRRAEGFLAETQKYLSQP